ncbi:MAG: DUF4097 family beta strand repeat-containing protein [Sporichthyaceae bacterium]
MAEARTTFAVDGPLTVQVKLHGNVSVEAREGVTEASVLLVPHDGSSDALERTVVDLSGRTLVVAGPRNGGLASRIVGRLRDREAVDATIVVPAGSTVKVATTNGEIRLLGTCADADLATGAGEIRVDRVDGDLRLRLGSGDSHISSVGGSFLAKTGSGNVQVGQVGGSLDCGCGSGDLTAAAVRGSVRFRAGSGDVHVDAVYGDVDVASGSGSLAIGLPAGVSARLDVVTGSGQLHSDLPVEQAPADGAQTIAVRARTGSGDVRVLQTRPILFADPVENPTG